MNAYRGGRRATLGGAALLVAWTVAAPAVADVFVANTFIDSVFRFDEVTGSRLALGTIGNATGLNEPSGIAIGPDGNTYVSSRLTGEILYFNQLGVPLPSPQPGGRSGLFATLPLNPPIDEGDPETPGGPAGLAFGPDGNLYVADFFGTTVRTFDAAGDFIGDAATGLTQPSGVTFSGSGDLFVSELGTGAISRVSGGSQTIHVAPGTAGMQTPGGMAADAQGALYVADLFGNQLLRFDSSGASGEQLAVIPPDIPNPLPAGAQFPTNFPSDVVLEPTGTLLVSVLGISNPDFGGADRGALLRYATDGTLIEELLGPVTPIGAIALGPSVESIPPGDYDGNSVVTAADYDAWAEAFGERVAIGSDPDGNADGLVNAADYTVWRDRLTAVGAEGAVATPEPAAWSMLVAVGLSGIVLRRRPRIGRPS